jgi:FtsP/CotA-like multicopper oxidase with cupredoxin domain
MYHSHLDEAKDVNSGLLGPIIVTARGKARPDGSPVDVDREFVGAFMQVHEEDSWLAARNIPAYQRRGPGAAIPNPSQTQSVYPHFVFFTINGYIHGNIPLESMTMRTGERVRWYLMASTNDFDFHVVHWHGNTAEIHGERMDNLSLMAMEMATADMVPDNPGTWLYHCHVTFHNAAGMVARYRVR